MVSGSRPSGPVISSDHIRNHTGVTRPACPTADCLDQFCKHCLQSAYLKKYYLAKFLDTYFMALSAFQFCHTQTKLLQMKRQPYDLVILL